MEKPIVERTHIRLGMIGASPGNGHPYSWSAIFNGYNPEKMATQCPYPGIADYLAKEPVDTLVIPNAEVTHICCTGNGDFTAAQVAECTNIAHVVDNPEELIGRVDAVIIATDIAGEHVQRVMPFIAAGVPVFVDKPMVDTMDDLRTFNAWVSQGKAILSSSSA